MGKFLAAPPTGKRRRAAMQAALYFARKRRETAENGGGAPAAPKLAATWNSIYGKGKRLPTSIDSHGNSLITAVSTTVSNTAYSPFSGAFDGGNTGGGPYFGGGNPTVGTGFGWTFDAPVAITGLAFAFPDGTGDQGYWDLEGSNDSGATWTPVTLVPFHWNMTSTGFDGTNGGCLISISNNVTAYKDYRMTFQSGTFSGNRLFEELYFQVLANPAVDQYASFVTTTQGATLSAFNRPIDELHDGLLQNGYSYPNHALDQVRFNNPTADDGIVWDFGAGNLVNIKRFTLDTDGQFSMNGTWKWQASADGTTWADSGSSFNWTCGSNQSDYVFPGGATGDKQRYWKLVYLSGSGSMNGMYEITFDLG